MTVRPVPVMLYSQLYTLQLYTATGLLAPSTVCHPGSPLHVAVTKYCWQLDICAALLPRAVQPTALATTTNIPSLHTLLLIDAANFLGDKKSGGSH